MGGKKIGKWILLSMKTTFLNFIQAIIPQNHDPQMDYVNKADLNFKLQIITYTCLVTALLVTLTIPLRLMSTEVA